MLVVRITRQDGPVKPGDYVVEATLAELQAEGDTPSEAVMFEGGTIWWRWLEEEEGTHCYERTPFMSASTMRRYGVSFGQ